MRKVYIVLTYTGTILSKIVKMYTHNEFSHVSISLDSELHEMYSFGRLNPYNPFWGGFVHEGQDKGTFKRFKKTKTRIYSLEVNDEQYEAVRQVINEIQTENSVKSYHFNMIGLFLVAIHLRFKREKSFYCAEFVKYVLDESNVDVDLPDIIKPMDFAYLDNLDEIFTGLLKDYRRV